MGLVDKIKYKIYKNIANSCIEEYGKIYIYGSRVPVYSGMDGMLFRIKKIKNPGEDMEKYQRLAQICLKKAYNILEEDPKGLDRHEWEELNSIVDSLILHGGEFRGNDVELS